VIAVKETIAEGRESFAVGVAVGVSIIVVFFEKAFEVVGRFRANARRNFQMAEAQWPVF